MARRRTPKRGRNGRFKKSGMGSLITVRRKNGVSGLATDSIMPPIVGGSIALLTALGIRYFMNPAAGRTQLTLVKWAPLFGLATGGIASGMLLMIGGQGAAVSSFLTASLVSAFGLGSDFVLKAKAGSILAALSSGAAPAAPAEGDPAAGTAGFGAIVMEPLASGRRAGSIGAIVPEYSGGGVGSYGETVSLSGINSSAFGTPGFRA